MRKLVYGVGVNDAAYQVSRNACRNGVAWVCPKYSLWKAMLQRGYSEKFKAKNPAYADVTVCEEWHRFSTFSAWLDRQDWQGLQLDKDLICEGNTEYNPETCVFVTQALNCLFTDSRASRGAYPQGVSKAAKTKNFEAKLSVGGKREYLGQHSTPEAAHMEWQLAKLESIDSAVANYIATDRADEQVLAAIERRRSRLAEDIRNSRVTVRL